MPCSGARGQVIFAASEHSGAELTEETIRAAFKTTKSIVYMCITFTLMIVMSYVSHRTKGQYLSVEMSLIALFGAAPRRPALPFAPPIGGLTAAGLARCGGSLKRPAGGYTVVATKAISEMLTTNFALMFTYWIFYVMLLMLVVTLVMQIRHLQEALQHFDSTEVIPANFVFFTIGTITTSGVIYDDFACMAATDVRRQPLRRTDNG